MTVSVALCTYNGEKYLEDQILTILHQSFPVSEIIVCDDRSKDCTIEILRKFQKIDNRIKIHINKENLGIIKNFEKAINLCKGDLIFLSDQDDLWKKEKVEKVVNYFEENKNMIAGFHNSELLYNTEKSDVTFWQSIVFNPQKDFKNFHENLLLFGNVVAGSAMAFRRESVELIEHPNIYHDYQLALNFARNKKIGYIDECLNFYRIHGNQQVGTTASPSTSKINFMKNFAHQNIGVEELKGIYRNYCKFKILNLHRSKFNFEENFLHHRLIEARKLFLDKLNFFERKKLIFTWYYRKIYSIKFKDLFFL